MDESFAVGKCPEPGAISLLLLLLLLQLLLLLLQLAADLLAAL